MIQKKTLQFLSALKANNNREWFEKNKTQFESAKGDFTLFLEELIAELAKINPALKELTAKDCLFRIYRDVRFSKNKDPYKVNFGAYLCEGGRKAEKPGFYIQIQPGGQSLAAGGCWMPPPPALKAIRQEIQYHTSDFKKILNGRAFKETFGGLSDIKLKTVPKGFSKEDPDLDLYRYTSYVVEQSFKDADVTAPGFIKQNVAIYKAMFPLLTFLNRAIAG